jgi:monoamine oxidase
MSDPAVIIIGAGAAGIGAAMHLRAQGVSFVVLEAAGRVGGRAFTDKTSLPGHWDQGCQWLHCADVNPLVALADQYGSSYLADDGMERRLVWAGGRWLDREGLERVRQAIGQSFEAVSEAATGAEDRSLAQVLPDVGPDGPFIRHLFQVLSSGDPEDISVKGYDQYRDTEVNWAVTSGYGDLIGRMAAGMPVRLGVPVTGISQRAGGVTVQTASGDLEARAAIVTASTNVLASGAIGFGPGPGRDMVERIGGIPCGSYEKVAFALKRLPDGITDEEFCWIDPGDGRAPADFQIIGGAHPKLIAHMAGGHVRELIAAGEAEMTAFARQRLIAGFGAGAQALIEGIAVTGWQKNPFVRGGYSYSKPGYAAERLAMIKAETGNIGFAGEAFSESSQATAHGAWMSGRDVAARLIRSERLV